MGTVRHLAENTLPPFVYRFAIRVYLWAIRGHGWHLLHGCYRTLADVPSTGHQNSGWYADLSMQRVGELTRKITRRPLGDGAGLLVLPLLVSELLRKGDALTVLDFGGGAAHGLKEIFEHVADPQTEKLRYILVEVPSIIAAVGQTSLGRAPYAVLSDKLPASLPHPSIIHARGSLPYVADWRAALAELLSLAPDIFVVAHTPMSDAPTFAQQQGNLARRRLARWVINRAEIVTEAERLGYRLSLAFDHEPAIEYGGPPLNDVSMVFVRATAASAG